MENKIYLRVFEYCRCSLHLLNSSEIQGKLTAANARADQLSKDANRPHPAKIRELYLAAFARAPRPNELKTALDYLTEPRTDAAGKPAYLATIHVRVRYGMMHVKRMDLEIGANVDGKARVEGLPVKAPALVWTVQHDSQKASVTQDLKKTCHATFDVALK